MFHKFLLVLGVFLGAACSVQPAVASPSISLTPSTATVAAGTSKQFTAVVSGLSNTAVTWSVQYVKGGSSTYGTITQTGLYTAPAVPPVSQPITITALASNGRTYKTAVVTVSPAPKVTLSPGTASVTAGTTQQFNATVTGLSNTALTWSVQYVKGGSTTYGTITQTGLYTAPATAPASQPITITALASDGKTYATSVVTVTAPTTARSVVISPSSVTLAAGQTQQFTATVTGLTNVAVTWSAQYVSGGNTTYGTITQTGLYTAPISTTSQSITITALGSDGSTYGTAVATISANTAPTSTTGRNFYVSTSGNDGNAGTSTAPWRTIQHAANVVQAGDTVHVLAGTYYESPVSNVNGTAAAPIRFLSETKWGAKVMGNGSANYGFRINGDYTILDSFDITNSNTSTGHLGVETEGNYDTVIGNHIHNINPNGGLDGLGGAAIVNGGDISKGYLDVVNNVIHDIGNLNYSWYQVHGIYYGSKGGHIYNNIVYRTQGWGIHLWHAASNITISNNTVFNNMQGGILVGDGDYPCPACVTDDYTIVTNNIVVYNQAHNYNGSSIGGYGISENGYTGTHNLYSNNLVYGNQVADYYLQNGLVAKSSISANPQFVNYKSDGTGDYHLLSASPAINAGTSAGPAPTFDLDGIARPVNSLWDIGAYEYH